MGKQYVPKYHCVFVFFLYLSSTQSACAILSSVACLPVPYFFLHYLIHGTIFGGKKVIEKLRVLIVSTAFV